MNYDKYGEVINGKDTYHKIARDIRASNASLIGWTDEDGTHLDILFAVPKHQSYGNFQRGIDRDDLFVSVIGKGAFAFKLNDGEIPHENYIIEKLGGGFGSTAKKLRELLIGIERAEFLARYE